MEIEMEPIESSNLREVGYDPDSKTLAIIFNSGMKYHYHDVPQETFDELKEAESAGKYFNANIRTSFNFENMGPA